MSDFDYKKYSLEQLENWMHDVTSGDATSDEIYDCIVNVVRDNYYHHKKYADESGKLLTKLGSPIFDYTATGEKWPIDHCMPPWGHSDIEAMKYTEEELNAMCDKAESDAQLEEIRKAGGYEWTPEQEPKKTLSHSEAIAAGWTMTDDGFWWPPQETTKKKWILPVEQVHDDYFISFPDDLLEAAKLKEGDEVNWIDNGDGSFSIRKVHKV